MLTQTDTKAEVTTTVITLDAQGILQLLETSAVDVPNNNPTIEFTNKEVILVWKTHKQLSSVQTNFEPEDHDESDIHD